MWANVQAIDVKFPQDLTHQKSQKSVNFWQSYFKNKKKDVFRDTVYVCCLILLSYVVTYLLGANIQIFKRTMNIRYNALRSHGQVERAVMHVAADCDYLIRIMH